NEVNAYVEKMDVDIDVKAKKQYKNVEVPTGEKTFFGKEKTETKKKETSNVIISKKDYKKLVNAAKENEHLKSKYRHLLIQIFTKHMTMSENKKNKSRINTMILFKGSIQIYATIMSW